MSLKLIILMIVGAIFIFALATYFLKKGRIPEKYALLWYFFALIILILSIFPGLMTFISNMLGFESPSNMLFLVLIAVLFLLIMAVTIMMAGQKKKTTLLIQEISLLNEKIDESKNRR